MMGQAAEKQKMGCHFLQICKKMQKSDADFCIFRFYPVQIMMLRYCANFKSICRKYLFFFIHILMAAYKSLQTSDRMMAIFINFSL